MEKRAGSGATEVGEYSNSTLKAKLLSGLGSSFRGTSFAENSFASHVFSEQAQEFQEITRRQDRMEI